ncbi:MAG: polysaccharide deacetylase family protein [Endomicrobiales bacterium]|nr:polysaccharide deacetylase family protein [Endomicrobiales bacterium]
MKRTLFLAVFIFSVGAAFSAEPGDFFTIGPKDRNKIVLTFDDGPGPYTKKILEVLNEHDLKATFFMDASRVEADPGTAKEVLEAGHEVGNHLYSHINFYQYKKKDIRKRLRGEIEKSEQVFKDELGIKCYAIRMPHGYVRDWVKEIARENGCILVNWTFGCDWKKIEYGEMLAGYRQSVQPGAILLMHDGGWNRKNTVSLLEKVIEYADKEGYEIVTLGELLDIETTKKIKAEEGN